MSHQSDHQHTGNLSMLNEQVVGRASSALKEQELFKENEPSCLADSDQCVVKCRLLNGLLNSLYFFRIYTTISVFISFIIKYITF